MVVYQVEASSLPQERGGVQFVCQAELFMGQFHGDGLKDGLFIFILNRKRLNCNFNPA